MCCVFHDVVRVITHDIEHQQKQDLLSIIGVREGTVRGDPRGRGLHPRRNPRPGNSVYCRMMIFHSWSVAVQTLLENPLRTLLSTLGVVIGVGSLVAILSLGDGLEEFTRNQIESTTDLQVINVAPITTDRIDDVLVRRLDHPVFTPADERDLATRLGTRAAVGTSLAYATFWGVPGDTGRSQAIVTAASPGYLDIVPFELLAGRVPDSTDMHTAARVGRIAVPLAPTACSHRSPSARARSGSVARPAPAAATSDSSSSPNP